MNIHSRAFSPRCTLMTNGIDKKNPKHSLERIAGCILGGNFFSLFHPDSSTCVRRSLRNCTLRSCRFKSSSVVADRTCFLIPVDAFWWIYSRQYIRRQVLPRRARKALPGWRFRTELGRRNRGRERKRVLLEAGGSDKTSTTEARRPGCF